MFRHHDLWRWTDFWRAIGRLSQDAADDLIARVLDAGINFIDTADIYSEGDSERILGKALGKRRKDVVLATKVFGRMGPGPNQVGLSRGHIMQAVEESLERLGTDYIDLYQIHGFDPLTPLEETLRALDDLVRSGKVRYLGCSNLAAWQLMKSLWISDKCNLHRFESLQAYYTIAGRDLEREVVPVLQDQNLGLMVWSPLAGGLLSGKFDRDSQGPEGARRVDFDFPPVDKARAFDVVDVMREIATEKQVSVARIALSWLLHQPAGHQRDHRRQNAGTAGGQPRRTASQPVRRGSVTFKSGQRAARRISRLDGRAASDEPFSGNTVGYLIAVRHVSLAGPGDQDGRRSSMG